MGMLYVMQSTIVSVTMFLTASFFVLFAARKTDAQGLKTFGYIVAVLLWISAALSLFTTISAYSARQQMMQMKRGTMQGQMPQAPMMKQQAK
ncbi:MAG: hypothetical protein ABSB18_08105 [Candidatus Omnitrophota bacterium]